MEEEDSFYNRYTIASQWKKFGNDTELFTDYLGGGSQTEGFDEHFTALLRELDDIDAFEINNEAVGKHVGGDESDNDVDNEVNDINNSTEVNDNVDVDVTSNADVAITSDNNEIVDDIKITDESDMEFFIESSTIGAGNDMNVDINEHVTESANDNVDVNEHVMELADVNAITTESVIESNSTIDEFTELAEIEALENQLNEALGIIDTNTVETN